MEATRDILLYPSYKQKKTKHTHTKSMRLKDQMDLKETRLHAVRMIPEQIKALTYSDCEHVPAVLTSRRSQQL